MDSTLVAALITLGGLLVMGFMLGLMFTAAYLMHQDGKVFKYYMEQGHEERRGD